MSTNITATATEPANSLTAPTPGADVDTWGEILNESTFVTLLGYILWLHENAGGNVTAAGVTYDNDASELTAEDVQAAIDEIVAGLGSAAAADSGDFATAAQGLPAGGTSGQVLKKASGDDYDTEWGDESGGGGGGAEDFTDLGDAPSDYTGAAGHYVRVNNTPDGVEFHQLVDGFTSMKATDESTYAGLTPDENTIYFIEADAS